MQWSDCVCLVLHFPGLSCQHLLAWHGSVAFVRNSICGWLGEEKMLCILRHRGIQLILAYSWAMPAILVAGTGRGGMFLFLLFLHFHSFSLTLNPNTVNQNSILSRALK